MWDSLARDEVGEVGQNLEAVVSKEFGFYSKCEGKLLRVFHRGIVGSILQL